MNGQRDSKQSRSNVVQEKSFAFAVDIVKTSRRLQLDQREWVLSKQLIRSGTSIGANIEEAIAAQSKKDFLSKMSIALKEARETHYWIRLIDESGLANSPELTTLHKQCRELMNLLSSITLTTRHNLQSNKRGSSPNAVNSSLHISNSKLTKEHSTFIIPHSTLGS
jgi:four helix bundle protein